MWFGIKPNRRPGRFTALDVLLADGLSLYEAGLCTGCGFPAVWVYDPVSARHFRHDPTEVTCAVCALLEGGVSDDPGYRPEPGEKQHIQNMMFDDDGPLGGGRG